jgi:ATP-dependent DNA helicase RecG
MTAIELLESLNALDEHERIEAKRAREMGPSILETICAFANEPGLGGGHLLLGVVREENALIPGYEVVGIDNPDKLSSDLATQCRTGFNMPIRIDIQTEQVAGKIVLVVTIPEAQPAEKPIYFQKRGLPKGAFRRVGSTDQQCTADDLAIFYTDRNVESFDYTVVPEATLDDLDPEALADYRQARAEISASAEELRWNDADLLQALGCARMHDGAMRPTVAGVLLFGKSISLRRFFPMMRLDYIRVPGKEWVRDPDKRFDSVDMRDSLFRLIRRAQAAVLDDLPKSFHLPEGQLQRIEVPTIPRKVIREAIVNSVMHRNYRVHSPIQIIRYSNRLEIGNPGFSLKAPEHLGEPASMARNPKIAAVLHETGYAETKGSGIRVMRDSMEAAGLSPPLFESDRAQDSFTARFLFHHFLGPDDIAWLSNFRDLHLNDAESRALIAVREAGAIDNSLYRELNHVDTLTASKALQRLRDAGLLEKKGKAAKTYYVPTDKLTGTDYLAANSPFPFTAEKLANAMAASKPSSLSSMPASLSPMEDALSGKSGALSSKSEYLSSKLADLPAELQARIAQLGQRNDPAEVKALIVALCRHQAFDADLLAQLLARNLSYVRTQYLTPLMREGLLEHTLPNEPNHPQQAYRAREETR